jgi:hypothetical protein
LLPLTPEQSPKESLVPLGRKLTKMWLAMVQGGHGEGVTFAGEDLSRRPRRWGCYHRPK